MDLANKLEQLFEAEGIIYNSVVVDKLASFIEDLIDDDLLAISDPDEASDGPFRALGSNNHQIWRQ